MNQWRWRPSDWLYHAEGGKHAIFRYVKQPAVDRHAAGDHFVGRVLRVSKRDLAFAYTAFGDASTDDAAAVAAVANDDTKCPAAADLDASKTDNQQTPSDNNNTNNTPNQSPSNWIQKLSSIITGSSDSHKKSSEESSSQHPSQRQPTK